jgi:hypothetical protein
MRRARVDPAERTGQLMSTPGLVRFGNELLLVVELPAGLPAVQPD